MSSNAKRRIRGGDKGPKINKKPHAPERDGGLSLPVPVAVSVALHVLALVAVIYIPGILPEREKPVTIYSVTMTTLPPGPAGGGGKETEPVKPPPVPVKKPEEKRPEEKPVKIAAKTPAKKAEPKKEPKEAAPIKPVAPLGPGQGPTGGGKEGEELEGPVTLEGGVDFPFGFYLDTLKKKVSRGWRPPKTSSRKRPKVIVFFRIDRMGRIGDIKVEQSSGVAIVDRSALSAVTGANPLPPLPEGFDGDRLGVHYTFLVSE